MKITNGSLIITNALFLLLSTTTNGVDGGTTAAFISTSSSSRTTSFSTSRPKSFTSSSSSSLNLSSHQNEDSSSWKESLSRGLATTALITGALWTSVNPSLFVPLLPSDTTTTTLQQRQQHHLQQQNTWIHSHLVANAKEMASGTGSRVNKDPESLLRYGLPIKNKDVRKLQLEIEDIKLDVGSKRKTAALDHVRTTRRLLGSKEATKLVSSCRETKVCTSVIEQMNEQLDPLNIALQDSMNALQGSEQERTALDKAYSNQKQLANLLTTLEEQMVPSGYITQIPSDYKALPRLQGGRATIEMIVKKNGGETFFVDGKKLSQGTMTMIVDGYTAPLTSGNFVDLVQKGFYNNMLIQRSDGFVVQTGEPTSADGAIGYVPSSPSEPTWETGSKGERTIPLEIYVSGDSAPLYESTIEEDGRGGQATVLPFSSYGAMGWARDEYEVNSGSSQFFWLLFDSDLTPAGKNILDGNYPCFGYVVDGVDFLADLKEGDTIVSAKVVKGSELLVKGE